MRASLRFSHPGYWTWSHQLICLASSPWAPAFRMSILDPESQWRVHCGLRELWIVRKSWEMSSILQYFQECHGESLELSTLRWQGGHPDEVVPWGLVRFCWRGRDKVVFWKEKQDGQRPGSRWHTKPGELRELRPRTVARDWAQSAVPAGSLDFTLKALQSQRRDWNYCRMQAIIEGDVG